MTADDDDIKNYAVNHCYCYSLLDLVLRLFTTTRLELDSKSKTTPRWGLIQDQHFRTIFIMPAHERGGNSRGRGLRVRPGESFSWRKKWCASQPASHQLRPPAGVRHFPLDSTSLSLSSCKGKRNFWLWNCEKGGIEHPAGLYYPGLCGSSVMST